MQISYLYASDLPFKNFIYSRHLTSFGSCYCKKQIDISFLCARPLIDFVITLSKFATATLTMLWCNLSIRGQVHKKTDVNLSNRHSILCKKTCMKYMYYTLWIKSSLFFLLGEKLEGLSSVLNRFWSTSLRRAWGTRGVWGYGPPQNFWKIGLLRCNFRHFDTLRWDKMCNFKKKFKLSNQSSYSPS